MSDEYLRPPQEHIDAAIAVENSVQPDELTLYLECMNGVPMSSRETPRDLRDGCILTHSVFVRIRGNKT